MKIQRMKDLIAEMREVARGETPAPADAALPSVESVEAFVRLLTPDNRGLLRVFGIPGLNRRRIVVRPWRAFAWLRHSLKNWVGKDEEGAPIMALVTSVRRVERVASGRGLSHGRSPFQKTLCLKVRNCIL
jgi:hypothetical protein